MKETKQDNKIVKEKKVSEKVVVKTSILGKPVVTEKSAKSSVNNTYVFNVEFGVTKSEISKAFQTKYKHKPVKVNILNKKRKSFWKKGVLGFGKSGKKAYITLPKGKTIEVI